MITNIGKSIIAKYLVGSAPAYASYIAYGCGATPRPSDHIFSQGELQAFAAKTSLDFEMNRSPIVSRGYVNDNGVNKIVLTAELPTAERYEITEVGIYSAGSNPAAGAYDSKTIYSFNESESWEYHSQQSAEKIPTVTIPLDTVDANVIENSYKINPLTKVYDASQPNTTPTPVFQTNADNKIFTNSERVARYERCRFLNNIIMMQGNSADLSTETIDGNLRLKVEDGSNHIHLTGAVLDFSKNSPIDELKLAFSIINKNGESISNPDSVRILVEFASSDAHGTGEWARFEVNIENGTDPGEYDFANNRYVVITKQLQELYKSTGFTWASVDIAKIYVSVIKAGNPTEDYYVGLDALRLESKSSLNPLYGMTGYSVIKNLESATIVKSANSTSYIEFRFAMDVQ